MDSRKGLYSRPYITLRCTAQMRLTLFRLERLHIAIHICRYKFNDAALFLLPIYSIRLLQRIHKTFESKHSRNSVSYSSKYEFASVSALEVSRRVLIEWS